jgi:hypothetical protein
MKTELEDYDIFPKVFRAGKKGRINVRPLGDHGAFPPDAEYSVRVVPMGEINANDVAHPYPPCEYAVRDGVFQVDYTFGAEGQYVLVISWNDADFWTRPRSREVKLRVYALEEDLFDLRPYRGDMHVHSNRSDGREAPVIVAANYRKAGFDFLALTDHMQYEPSLEAIAAFRDSGCDLRLFPGEEVHAEKTKPMDWLPGSGVGNNSHYVNFGGDFSVNAVFREDPERYRRERKAIEDEVRPGLPPGINAAEYSSALWVIREIHRAGGLAIMAHPCWIDNDAYHIRADMYRFLLEHFPFDALELTCGQTREENQMQVSLWQQMREEGHAVNIVGSSDSHGTVNSDWFNLSKMVVLASSCERDPIIEAVRSGMTIVLEQYAGEPLPRLYGRHRPLAFVLFLLDEFFPLHDELCFEEGRLMKDYAVGDGETRAKAGKALKAMSGRCEALFGKYWA